MRVTPHPLWYLSRCTVTRAGVCDTAIIPVRKARWTEPHDGRGFQEVSQQGNHQLFAVTEMTDFTAEIIAVYAEIPGNMGITAATVKTFGCARYQRDHWIPMQPISNDAIKVDHSILSPAVIITMREPCPSAPSRAHRGAPDAVR